MTKINKKSSGFFTITNNQLIRDDRLSWKARGIFTYLWSMSDGWDFRVNEVSRHAKDGRDSLRAGLKELEEYGYLKRHYKQSNGGKLDGYEWILNDTPAAGKSAENSIESNEIPATGKPGVRDNRQPENPPLSNINLRNTNLSNIKDKEPSIRTPSPLSGGDGLTSKTKEILDYLNQQAGTSYRASSKATQRFVHARLNENYTVEDFKKVIDIKVANWKDEPKMSKFLRPSTLFGTKFEGYLNEPMPNIQPDNPYDRYYE
ncbi:Rep protein [Limosilactobacillus fermentum]